MSQHRFDPSTEQVTAAIQAGDLGRLTSGIASTAWWRGRSYYDSGRWRGTWAMDGGGAIMNQTIHTIDLLVAMLGVPTEVLAYAAVWPMSGSRSRTPPWPWSASPAAPLA